MVIKTMASLILLLPFLAALVGFQWGKRGRVFMANLSHVATAMMLLLTLCLYPFVHTQHVISMGLPWIPALNLDFSLRIDGLSWLFMLLITGIGLLITVYARYYMPNGDPLRRFYVLLLAFIGSMLGIVIAGSIIGLVFFWEMTSLTSFLLIGYWHHGGSARDGARMALIITSGGGLALFAGAMMIGQVVGSYDLGVILASADTLRSSPLYTPILLLILLGAFTKSAQFPFHFWLPQAMSAPTPISAYLHSATMVKAGVFLLIRFAPVLGGTSQWFWLVGGIGMVTLVLGAYVAMFEQDLKGILAYSTISNLGLITMLVGMGSSLGIVAAIFHVVNHATFKSSLFMAAGAIDHETGTRDMRKLGGLAHAMPITTTLACISGAAMAGVPLFNGFLSKEMFFAETVNQVGGSLAELLPAIMAVAASAFGLVYSLRFVGGAFFGKPTGKLPKQGKEPPVWMYGPIGFLALACLAVGIMPGLVIGESLKMAAISVLGAGNVPAYSLRIWHGLNAPILMSIGAFAIGSLLYAGLANHYRQNTAAPWIGRYNAQQIFERILSVVTIQFPDKLKIFFPSKHLQPQVLIIVLVALFAAALAATESPLDFSTRASELDPAFLLLWLSGCLCAVGAATQAKFHRLAALIMAGGAGLATSITFAWLSAPDLAITQLLVETVTTILILLGLRWLPKRTKTAVKENLGAHLRRRRDVLIAASAGTGVAVLAYLSMSHPPADSMAHFFVENALTGGGGRNIVNVILVDFRAFDTLGEISVLAIVALIVFSLLRRFRPAVESMQRIIEWREMQLAAKRAGNKLGIKRSWHDDLKIPSTLSKWIAPVLALFALNLFLRGHNLPGGGFAAGVSLAGALISLYMILGARWVETHLRVLPLRWMGIGLLLALLTGIGSWFLGYPFMTTFSTHLEVPLLGEIPIASALLFDLGVFATVVGTTTLLLIALAHQSLRRPHLPSTPKDTEDNG